MATETVKYQYYSESNRMYECEAEIVFGKEDGQTTYEVTLLNVFDCGIEGEDEPLEVFPYARNFNLKFRTALENRAVEAYYDQATAPEEPEIPQYFTFSVNVQWAGFPTGRLIMVKAFPKNRILETWDLAPNRPERITEMPNAVYQYLLYCAFGEQEQDDPDGDHAAQPIEEAAAIH